MRGLDSASAPAELGMVVEGATSGKSLPNLARRVTRRAGQ